MNIAIVTSWNAAYQPLADLVIPNRQAYCDRHGYTLVTDNNFIERAGQWGKIDLARRTLPEFDAVFVMDLDAIFTNENLIIEDLADRDMTCTRDLNGFNNGQFIIKNTEWARQLLDVVWTLGAGWSHYPNPDQSCLVHHLVCEDQGRWSVKPQRSMNSYLHREHGLDCPVGEWQPGDFVLHVPNLSLSKRLAVLSGLLH